MSQVTLKQLSTRELLEARREARFAKVYDGDRLKSAGGFMKRAYVAGRLVKGGTIEGVFATEDELQAELATRSHVPNKSEGKLLRRLMAQTGQSADWLRAHPKYGQMLVDHQHPNRKEITKSRAAQILPYVGNKHFREAYKVVK